VRGCRRPGLLHGSRSASDILTNAEHVTQESS
jgi:hypothetical protein